MENADLPKATSADLNFAYNYLKEKHETPKNRKIHERGKGMGYSATSVEIDNFINSLLTKPTSIVGKPFPLSATSQRKTSQPVAKTTTTTTHTQETQSADKKITTSKKRRIRRNKCVAWHKKQASLAQQKNQLVAIKN